MFKEEQVSHSLNTIHTLYVGSLTGESGFGRRLIDALEQMGRFAFTDDRTQADAVVEAHGEDTEEAFIGDLALRDLQGNLLWSARSERPHESAGPMAYERLLAELQGALPANQEQTHSA